MPRMLGTLYLVSTPIGNLEDITQRAVRILREVDLIASEDTRHTKKLLSHFGISTRTTSYHEHNERERAEELCTLLESGRSIALVSDAGTPLINDPGFRLVSMAIEREVAVVPVPGPAAFVAALAASGLPTDQFFFAGFLPPRATARRSKLEELAGMKSTLIFYEAPHRICATLRDALELLGDRQAVIARELTKLHEEFSRGGLSDLVKLMSAAKTIRGEKVLLIAGAPASSASPENPESVAGKFIERMQQLERDGVDAKSALKQAAREMGLKRDEAYRLVLAQKNFRAK